MSTEADYNKGVNVHKRCCDPFNNHDQWKTKGLREISMLTMVSHPSLQLKFGDRVCTQCRKMIANLPREATEQHQSSSDAEDDCIPGTSAGEHVNNTDTDAVISPEHQLSLINTSLCMLGESPVVKRKLTTRVNYVKTKIKRIQHTMKRKLELITDSRVEESTTTLVDTSQTEMIDQLKEKFQSCTRRSEKIQVLTVLPRSWTVKRIEQEFQTSNYMGRKAKKLVEEKGILSTPNPKLGKRLTKDTADGIKLFYCSDSISRLMPGMKDFVSVIVNGKRQPVQKRLVLCNIKEAFLQYKETNPDQKIGFSTFAALRPKECILAGGSGTHTVCVCTIHQNIKLMFEGAKLERVCENYTYHNSLAEIQCNPPRVQCFVGACEECPGLDKLQAKLAAHFDEQMIDRIEFKQWTTTDRSTLETKIQSVDEFIQSFVECVPKVLHHDFVAKQQSKFLQECKLTIAPGTFIVVGDFAENYSFIVQDASQSFHWNNLQATIHPFVCYYRKQVVDASSLNPLQHVSFVVISESNTHDTVAVHLFQKVLIRFLIKEIEMPKKVLYFSDGCAAQYKNRKNFANLCCHEQDFGMPGEWHFFATSHGKGPCDGVGGTVKRLAARASLQRPYDNQIVSPRQLFDFAQSEISSVNFYYATVAEHEQEATLLKSRLAKARTIAGTHKLHCICPLSPETVKVKEFSKSEDSRVERVMLSSDSDLKTVDIKGYVTAKYDGYWWLGCVLQTMLDSSEVEVNFLHPHGPARSFKYPEPADILVMSCHDILTRVEPSTATGRTYTLSDEEASAAITALKNTEKQ